MIIHVLFALAVFCGLYSCHKALKAKDLEIAAFQFCWVLLIGVWVWDVTLEVDDSFVITQSLWCFWSIHIALLLKHMIRESRYPYIVFPSLFILPFLIPDGESIWLVWSVCNLMLSLCVLYRAIRLKDSFLLFHVGVYLVGFFVTEITFNAAMLKNGIELSPALWAWYVAETMINVLLILRLKKAPMGL